MVVGFFFAMLMMHVVSYAGELFSVYYHGATGNETFSGPISAAAGMFLGAVILIILTHKSLSLIHYLPEMVIRWVGAGGGSMGEQSDLAESRRTIVGGVASHTPRTAGHGRSASIAGGAAAGGAMAVTTMESDGGGDQESQSEDHQPGESGNGPEL